VALRLSRTGEQAAKAGATQQIMERSLQALVLAKQVGQPIP
jgi:hypothetical protein